MKKKIVAILALSVILTLCCATALAYSGDVTRWDVKAYSDSEMTQYIGTIPAGTSLMVRSYDSFADVYVNGKLCYIDADALIQDDFEIDYLATLIKGTRVYQRATTSAKSLKVKAATDVKVCSVSGDWALVQATGSTGAYGFVKIDKLTSIRLK